MYKSKGVVNVNSNEINSYYLNYVVIYGTYCVCQQFHAFHSDMNVFKH